MGTEDTNLQITRRTFLEGVAANAAALTVAGALAGSATIALAGCTSSSGTAANESSASASSASAGAATASGSASAASAGSAAVDERYTADLTDLFADKAAFDAEVARLENETIPALKQAAGQVSDEASLVAYLGLYDEVAIAVSKVDLYATMRFNVDSTDPDAQTANSTSSQVKQETDLANAIVKAFLVSQDEATWQAFLSSGNLALWYRYLQKIYNEKSHVLASADEELLRGAQTAQNNVTAQYTTLNGLSFYLETTTDPQGNEVIANKTNFGTAMYSVDRDYRERMFETYYRSVGKLGDIFAGNYHTYVKLDEDLAAAHEYNSALEGRMEENDTSQETFDMLVAGTQANLDAYAAGNKLRAKALGIDALMPWDRIVPLVAAPDTSFSYEDAQSLIIAALAPLGNDYAGKLKEIFAHRWIDAAPTPGKTAGAAMCETISGHPYLFMSYCDDFSSVDTLAHELGHFVHNEYSIAAQKFPDDRSPRPSRPRSPRYPTKSCSWTTWRRIPPATARSSTTSRSRPS